MNRYNQVPHLTQDTIWESDKNTRKHHTHKMQEVSPFPVGDLKASKKQTRQYDKDKHETQITNNKKGPTKETPPWNGQ